MSMLHMHMVAHCFLAALLASLPCSICCDNCSEIFVIVRGADFGCWWRSNSKQNQFTAVEWGLLMVLKGAEKTAARLSHWTYAEIHLFCACSLTALLVRTKSF